MLLKNFIFSHRKRNTVVVSGLFVRDFTYKQMFISPITHLELDLLGFFYSQQFRGMPANFFQVRTYRI